MIDSAVVTSTTSSAKTIIQENSNQVPRNARRDNITGARGTCIQGKKRNLSIRIILILLWPVYPAVRGSFLSWSCTNWNGGVFLFLQFFC